MMVLDLTCLATRKANLRSRNSASVGARLVATFSVMTSTTALPRLCTRSPPATSSAVSPAARVAAYVHRGAVARALVGRRLERCVVMRIIAVAQRLDQAAAEGAEFRRL